MSWIVEQLARYCRGHVIGDASIRVEEISNDTRTLAGAALYVAIRGESFDGHAFIPEAVRRGAVAALVSDPAADSAGVPTIRADDTVVALGDMARLHRGAFALPVIAITGSNGKTTTKEMCAGILEAAGREVRKSPGNLNNHIGLPLSVLRLGESDDVLVLEMGMNHPGEIDALARIARPTVGAITQVAPAHLGPVGSIEAIARAKGELLDHIPADGVAVLNADDRHVMGQSGRCAGRVVTFGVEAEADFRAAEIRVGPEGTRFSMEAPAGRIDVEVGLPGAHIAQDALCAAAAAHASGMIDDDPLETIRRGLQQFRGVPGRNIVIETKAGARILDDTYNANPTSVRAALRTLGHLGGSGRSIAVLGDMLELGPEAADLHASIGRSAVEAGVEILIGVGPLSADTVEAARTSGLRSAEHAADADNACRRLLELVRRGDRVLIMGSRAMRMETIASALQGSD